MKIGQYETHPIADAFRMLVGEAWDRFLEDVKLRGLVDDVGWLYKGKILDARHRALAAEQLGLKMKWKEYTGDDPLGFVLSRNFHRRHDTLGQRALVATKLCSFVQGRPKKSGGSAGLPQKAVAASMGMDERRIREAKTVVDNGAPEVVEALDAGELALEAAVELAKLPKSEQLDRLKAELAPAPRPRRPRNDNDEQRPTPASPQELMRVARRAFEALGATTKGLVADGENKLVLQVAYAGQLWRVEVALEAAAESAA